MADLTITLPDQALRPVIGVLNIVLSTAKSTEFRNYRQWLELLRTVLIDADENPDRHTLPPGVMALIMTPDTIREVADLPEHVTDAHIKQAISDAANTERFALLRDLLGDAWDSAVHDIGHWAAEIADAAQREPATEGEPRHPNG